MLPINILLLIAGFAGSIIAFGGDTWAKGTKPLLDRINGRGWLSILLLIIALALGVYKEVLTKSQDAKKDSDAKARESLLQNKLDGEANRLGFLQSQMTVTQSQLTNATQALAENKHVVGGMAKVEMQIHGQVDSASQQISIGNANLQKTKQVLDAMGGLQTQIRDVTLLTALTKNQSQLNVEVRIPIHPIYLSEGGVPKTVVDLIVPKWREDGIQDPEGLLLALELESYSRPYGKGLNGSLWGFRKDPYKIVTLGLANVDPLKEGTETSLEMYGDVSVTTANGQNLLVSSFRFPKSQVPGQWLSEFRVGTKLFSVEFVIRNDLDASERQRLIDFWNHMFLEAGTFRIPLLDQDNFFMEYQLKRSDAVFLKSGSLSIISLSYSIASLPTFRTRDL